MAKKIVDAKEYFDEIKKINPKFKREYGSLEEEFAIANEVIKLRIKTHMTQKELAKKIGSSQSSIARLESGGHKNLSLSFLRRVGEALGARLDVHFKMKRV